MSYYIPELLVPLLAKPVAVFGGGVSGRAVLDLLGKLGARGVLYDEKQPGALADFTAENARAHRLVVFSPGFRPEHRWLALARLSGLTTLGELDFGGLFWRGTILAITGTNGKTTLTEFLTYALQQLGRDARATGNVGFPLTQLVADTEGGMFDTVAVCEVSSFQAETLVHFRADATLWTNFAEDHLERHPGMKAYFDAKWRLLDRTVGGVILAGSSVVNYAAQYGRLFSAESAVATEAQPADVLLAGTVFADYPQRENFILAAAWWHRAGLPEAALYAAAHSFKLGRHRLRPVRNLGGVTYWNDSKATNFHAVEAALASFASPVLLIAGGKPKGGDVGAFVRRSAPKIRKAFLIGQTKEVLAEACAKSLVAFELCPTLAAAVEGAAEAARPGDHVLLSPAFASFDMFRSYEDRGNQFEELVNKLEPTTLAH